MKDDKLVKLRGKIDDNELKILEKSRAKLLSETTDVLATATTLLIRRTLRIAVSKQVITSRQAQEIKDILFAEIDKQVEALK